MALNDYRISEQLKILQYISLNTEQFYKKFKKYNRKIKKYDFFNAVAIYNNMSNKNVSANSK